MFNLKNLGFSAIGASLLTGVLAYPASAILLSTLNNSSSVVPAGDFVFSGFSVIDWPSRADDTNPPTSDDYLAFLNFNITGNVVNGNPVLSFAFLGTIPQTTALTISGAYTLDYQVTYVGTGNPFEFISYGQTFCTNEDFTCDASNIRTNIYETAGDRSTPPPNNNSLAFAETNIDQDSVLNIDTPLEKLGSPVAIPTAFARTTINVASGDEFTDFTGTYGVQEVPWDTNAAPLVGATLLFGGGMWWKRRRAAANQIDLTGQEADKESEA